MKKTDQWSHSEGRIMSKKASRSPTDDSTRITEWLPEQLGQTIGN